MRDLRDPDGRVARPRHRAARRPSSRTCTSSSRSSCPEHFDLRALRRRQHAQHPRPLPRARPAAWAASSATACAGPTALTDGRDRRSRPHGRPRHVGPEGRAVHARRRVRRRRVRAGRAAAVGRRRRRAAPGRLVVGDRRARPGGSSAARPMPSTTSSRSSVTSQWSGTVPVDRDGDAAARRDHLDGLARCRRRSAGLVGGRREGRGLRPAQAAHVHPAHRRRARALGQGPDRAHPLAAGASGPTSRRATWKYLEPKDWLNLKLTGRAAATFDSIVLHWLTDNRDLARIDVRARAARAGRASTGAQLPDLVAATDVLGAAAAPTPRPSSASPPGIPVVGGTPDLQSAAVGSGAVADFEGHLYLGHVVVAHVPRAVQEDRRAARRRVAAVAVAGQVLRRRRAGDGGRVPQLAARPGALPRRRAAAPARRRPTSTSASTRSPRRTPPGSHGVIFTPWLNGERTPVDDHTVRGGWMNQSLSTTRADLVRSTLEGVAFNSRWLLGAVEKFVGRPLRLARTRSAAARRPTCGARSTPTCSTARSARSSTRSARTHAARR